MTTTLIQFEKNDLIELIESSVQKAISELNRSMSQPPQDRIDKEIVKQMTGQGDSWVYKKTYKGCQDPLPYEKFGKRLVFSRRAIQEYIDDHTKPVTNPSDEMGTRLAKSAKKHLNKC